MIPLAPGRQPYQPRPRLVPDDPTTAGYRWLTAAPDRLRFLQPVCSALGLSALELWIESDIAEADLSRSLCGGLVTAVGKCQGRQVAIIWSDFRVNAASYGRANSARVIAFLRHLDQGARPDVPLMHFVNSAGISLMEGRTVFSDAFALWPALLSYGERHVVLTCAIGKCLGLAPLLYGLGHYRVAVSGQTHLNLTGPEVIRLFFGHGVDFEQSAAAERYTESTDLIHDLVPSVGAACARFAAVLGLKLPGEPGEPANIGPRMAELFSEVLDAPPTELVAGWCDRLRLFLGTRHGAPVGIFINPPERSNNMITVRTLDKYAAGLDLFRALRVPIVSFLDSPGFDPRVDQSTANNFRRMIAVGDRIIRYPHGAMGVVVNRCFGGAATLIFPKVFGGQRVVALRGSRFGVMQDSIVDRLLGGSPRLHQQWKDVAARQTPDLADLLAHGSLDAVVDLAELGGEIDHFLRLAASPRLVPATTRRSGTSSRARRARTR